MTEQQADIVPEEGLSWFDLSWIMLSDVVGTSVLTLNGVAARLGFVLTVAFICGTMGQVAGATFRSAHVGRIVTLVVYGYTLLGQASYMLVLGNTLQTLWWQEALRDSVALCFFNSMLILAVIVIALVRLGYNRPDCKHTYWFEPGVSLLTCLGAATNVVYSFKCQDFPKAFLVSGPFMLTTYLSVALLGYWFGSGKMDLVGGMPHGPTLQVAAVLLFMHVVIVYLLGVQVHAEVLDQPRIPAMEILSTLASKTQDQFMVNSVVLIRYAHGSCRPGQVEKRSCRSYLEHGGWGVGVLLFCFLVSNIIPFFSQLLGIIGGFFAGPFPDRFPSITKTTHGAGKRRPRSSWAQFWVAANAWKSLTLIDFPANYGSFLRADGRQSGWRGLTGGVHVRHDGAGTREQGRPSGGRNWPGARALVVVVTGRLGDLLAGDGVDRQKDAPTMQTAPVYSAPPTTYGAPTMFPTYMAPGTMPVTYAAPTYAAPQPVQTVTGPVMTTLAASPAPVATGTPAEPIGEPTMTTTTAVETAVSTQMFPPQPRSSPLQTIMGPVTQIKIPVESVADPGKATMSQWAAQFQALQVDGEPQYMAGVGSEVNAAPQVMIQRQEQVVAGQVKQKITEIPTVEEVVMEQEVPEIQYVNKIVEVPEVRQQQFEQIVEQVVHVPQIVEQKRVQHRHIEQFVDVPVTQASPPQEQVVEIPVPMQEEEIFSRRA
eukprot:g28934.t1